MCKPANVIFPPAYIYVKVFLTECIVSGIRYSASEGPTIDSFNLVSPEGNGANRYQSTCH